jgi:chromosome segregation ATPase
VEPPKCKTFAKNIFCIFQSSEAEVKKCKIALDAAKKKWNEKEAEEASLKLEISELKKSIEESVEQIRVTTEAIAGFEVEIERLSGLLAESREAVDAAKAAVKAQKDTLLANNKEIASLNSKIDKTVKQNQAHELEIKKLQNDIEKVSCINILKILTIPA